MSRILVLRIEMVMQLESKPGPMTAERMYSDRVRSTRIGVVVWRCDPRVFFKSLGEVVSVMIKEAIICEAAGFELALDLG